MNKEVSRLDILADGVFAIVMTILVFEIKVPEIINPSNEAIFELLKHSYPLFLSYILSFAVLFTYWRGYHSIVSDFAKSFDVNFQNLAGAFLLFVGLVPFSSHLLGVYNSLPASVIVFSLNVIVIGVLLFLMRLYAWKSRTIKNKRITKVEQRHAHIRIFIPIVFSLLAIPVAFINTKIALSILTIAIIFNLLKRSTRIICEFLEIEHPEPKKDKIVKVKVGK
ncbi:MAG: TMEM175 family protein [Candidatus Paceibacterota bacterium]